MLEPTEHRFAANFIRDFKSPHARQRAGDTWKTYYQPIPDAFIHSHLTRQLWLGTKACWYPVFFNLDVDRPTPERVACLEDRFDRFGIREGQRAYVTSPSYAQSGNFRVYLRPQLNTQPVTWRLGYEALSRAFGDLAEIYPQQRRKDRLPCGRDQHLIADGVVLRQQTWEDQLHFLLKLDTLDLNRLPRQHTLFELSDNRTRPAPRGDAAELLAYGLQAAGTRHHAQFQIANYLFRANVPPDEAKAMLRRWIRAKHNGYSREAGRGNWRTIFAEIERQVAHIWTRYQIPDKPFNSCGALHREDLLRAAELFPSDVVRQKQYANLAGFYRARQHHEWVFISRRIWRERIAGYRTYKGLIGELEAKGVLRSMPSYQSGEYARRFQLELPAVTSEALQWDERNEVDYYAALRLAFDDDLRSIRELTKLDRMTFWRHFERQPSLPLSDGFSLCETL